MPSRLSSPFRAYDIRGIYGENLTDEFAQKLGYALGKFVKERKVSVGRDSRYSSPILAENLIKGIAASGKEVDYVGEVPNPITYFYCWREKIPGAYVTASHNPPQYNGFKLIRGDGTSFTHEYSELKKFVAEVEALSFKRTEANSIDAVEDYMDFVLSKVEVYKKIKVVVETFGGVINKVIPVLLEKLGAEYKILHSEIRGDFYGLRPEPKGDNLDLLRREVLAFGADFGVAFDGDSDRSVFVDSKGRVLNGSQAGIVFVKHLVKKGSTVVLTPDTSRVLEKVIKDLGGKVVYSRIGHGFIEEKVRDTNATIGIEQSSHFYFGYLYPFSDGILSTLIMAQIASQEKVSKIVDEHPAYPMEKIYIDAYSDEIKHKVVSILRKEHPDAVDIHDGFKVFLEDSWILIRVSQTMPEVNLVIEAPTEEKLVQLKNKYIEKIERIVESLRS
ncbi:MAG: hypothetical protein DRJ63_08125 [Thermoprotei archaeon]|nr:MAG: hypothetical protein DRJ63_08125 [Thermoprotei archaeon]